VFLYLSKLLPVFFYPIGLAVVLGLAGAAAAWWGRRRTALALAVIAALQLWAFSTPLVSLALLAPLEGQFPVLPAARSRAADAIVVLGGSLHQIDRRRPTAELTEGSDRILFAARLYRAGKAPLVLMTGGNISFMSTPEQAPEALLMAELAHEFGVPRSALLTETASQNTRENAVLSAPILRTHGVRRILLVTSAFHMPRSVAIFRRLGFEVIPAATDVLADEIRGDWLFAVLPSAEALFHSTTALKEWFGLVVYRLRGWA